MSVCKYTPEFYPMLRERFDDVNDVNHENFKQFVEENFQDAQKVISEFLSGSDNGSTQSPKYKIEPVGRDSGIDVDTDSKVSKQYYTGNSKQYDKMKNDFTNKIVSFAVYDKDSGSFVNPNAKNAENVSNLNQSILDYKKSLLKEIADYLGMQDEIPDNFDRMEGLEAEGVFNNILRAFSDLVSRGQKDSSGYNSAYNAYTVLKTFDDILKNATPFIGIDDKFADNPYSNQRYVYNGPSVKLESNWGNSEHSDVNDNVSELTKILLNYFPEVDSNGNDIGGTSISWSGFLSSMTKFKDWLSNSTNPEVIEERNKGVGSRDMSKLLKMYLADLKNNKIINDEHKSYLVNKINGISKFVFNDSMDETIRHMFAHMADKFVLSGYVAYKSDKEGNVGVVNLTERAVSIQRLDLQDIVAASSVYWKENQDRFKDICDKYKIVIDENKITINNVTLTKNDKGEVSIGNGKIDNLNNILEEIACIYIADDFDQVASQIVKNGADAQKLYTPLLYTVLQNAKNSDKALTVNYGQIKELAKVLSVINGSDLVNVIKNAEGNNLPLYQLVSLVYRDKEVAHRIKQKLEANPERALYSPLSSNVVYNNIDKVLKPVIRTDISYGGNTKSAADATVSEIGYVAIGKDFLHNLLTENSVNDNRTTSGIIGIQSHCYSDKSRHFIMRFDLTKDWTYTSGNKTYRFSAADFRMYLKTANPAHLNNVKEFWYQSSKDQIENVKDGIINDYNEVFGKNFTTLAEVKDFINDYLYKQGHSIDDVRDAFWNKGINFVDELHTSKVDKKYTINETLEELDRIFSSKQNFGNYLTKQFAQFLDWAKGSWELLKKDQSITKIMHKHAGNDGVDYTQAVFDKQGNPTGEYELKYEEFNPVTGKNEINPILYAYFIADNFLGNDYNKMMVGEMYAHPNKEKESSSAPDYVTHAWASRWIAQVKRMVIMGATYHPYAQDLKYGVAQTVKMAVMPDETANVANIVGNSKGIDANDGSGWTHPIFSRMQNVSLIDAKVENDKKTIYHDVDATKGWPITLKWAEYEITNALRRSSQSTSLENIYRKMSNFAFDHAINFDEEVDNLYFRYTGDSNDKLQYGKYYKINKLQIVNAYAIAEYIECTKSGSPINSNIVIPIEVDVNNIYDIDQLLGGAWSMEINEHTNDLQYTEKNLDILHKIVCDNNAKDKMIGWVVNESAIKVGKMNVNRESSWKDGESLHYMDMSTKFGGVQMDADHELEDAETTEASQMISGLEQNGYTHNLAMQAYNELGRLSADSVKDIRDAVDSAKATGNVDKLYEIFGKAIIESFSSGSKDTLGLAQAFVALAQKGFDENNINYRIPFSSSSIYGLFNSTITSTLIKKAIRRHYAGVASVLHPSYNTMETYNIGGKHYKYDELIDLVDQRTKGTIFEGKTVRELMTVPTFTFRNIDGSESVEWNPFIEQNIDPSTIDFEDTILIQHNSIVDNNGNQVYIDPKGNITDSWYSIVKIDNIYDYTYYKTVGNSIGTIHRWTLQPKNLKGSDTRFWINGKQYSMHESDEVITLRMLNNLKIKRDTKLEDITKEASSWWNKKFGHVNSDGFYESQGASEIVSSLNRILAPYVGDGKVNIQRAKRGINKNIQKILNNLGDNKPFVWKGMEVVADKYEVTKAQIVMGKYYAKQLGLLPGDNISTIKEQGSEFFYNRISGYYNVDNEDTNTYDWVLFDGTGKKLYVKYIPKDTDINTVFGNRLDSDSDFKTINGKVYLNDNELCSASDDKSFYTYTDEKDNLHNLVVIRNVDRFNELYNSGAFVKNRVHRNYTEDNYKMLIDQRYRNEDGTYNIINVNYFTNKGKTSFKNISDLTEEELMPENFVRILRTSEEIDKNFQIKREAENKYNSFEKSLQFIGTRIPCQGMQSFDAMEVVAFTDDDLNRIYLPAFVAFIVGEDFD